MLEVALIPLGFYVALKTGLLRKKDDDRSKIKVFFEIAGIAIKHDDRLQYPDYLETFEDSRSKTYIYRLPLGMPFKVLEKVQDVVSEGLGKPVRISYDNYKMRIRVFNGEIPTSWDWSPDLVQEGKWIIPIGRSLEGIVYHDFDKTPHMTLGGLVRMGKTVFLKVLFTTLSLANPKHAHFYLIDLKEEGLEFSEFSDLQQVEGIATKVEEAYDMLQEVMVKMNARGKYMKENRIKNIVQTSEKDRYFVIVDEGAVLAPAKGLPKSLNVKLEECQYMLSHIARVGGALGFRVIFCTQYPTADTLPRVIKQMADAKLGLRLPTRIASEVVIDEPGLEDLPQVPGRAIFKTDKCVELQVPMLEDVTMRKLLEPFVAPKEVKQHVSPSADAQTETDSDIEYA
ncbi:FtsK/SpoIIIE domain-containing protein [Ectobacillus antri]|uniref:FtsK/SpoIIIE domain-containing protein n=1 Tax=Ectobacillus antri TaxID=2486280 RepID=UPI000F59B5D0|nr:FtsK/SpoIIIE domain-containing protein [Ectobacillus antri]